MAKNDFNYYKNEYGKYKDTYYTPGNEDSKKKNSERNRKSISRFLRAFFVFIIIFAIIAGAVYGIIKLSSKINFSSNKNEETTTVAEKTTSAKKEKTTKEQKSETNIAELKVGSVGVIKTKEGNGIYLRNTPSYDVTGFTHISDGTKIKISEISDDGSWCKTSNFDINGWVNVKYVTVDGAPVVEEKETTTKSEKTTVKEKTTKEKTTAEKTTEIKTDVTKQDSQITNYNDAMKEFSSKPAGTKMNCKIVSNGTVFGKASPDENAGNIVYLVNGDSVVVTEVGKSFSKVFKYNAYSWVPNSALTFVSWS